MVSGIPSPSLVPRSLWEAAWSCGCIPDINPVQWQATLLDQYLMLRGLEPHSVLVSVEPQTRVHCWAPAQRRPWYSRIWHTLGTSAHSRTSALEEEQPQEAPQPTTTSAPRPAASSAPSEEQQEQAGSLDPKVSRPWYANLWPCEGSTLGKRQAVLLLHGFGASGAWQWVHQVGPLAAAGIDVFLPDLVFFGGSHSGSRERSVEFQAECMLKLMDHFGVERFHVVGISYGGFVAYHMAVSHPARVLSLVLTNSGLMGTQGELRTMLKHWHVASPSELLLPTTPQDVQRLLNLAYHQPHRPPTWILQKTLPVLFESMVEEKRELLENVEQEAAETEEEMHLRFPTPPAHIAVLLVWGRHDAVFPVAIGERMKRMWGGSTQLVVLDDASHLCSIEKSKEYNSALICFLKT